MKREVIEERMIDEFIYKRYRQQSRILAKEITYGVIQSRTNQDSGLEALETIYFLHGGDGNDQQFVSSNFLGSVSNELKTSLNSRRIQIVLPDIGLSYLKAPLDSFLLEELPASQIRHLYGVSMGGTAAFNVFFKYPERFNSIACHFPGLIEFNPFDASSSSEYQSKTGISDAKMAILLWCYQTPFANEEEFKENDPQLLLNHLNVRLLDGKKIFFDCARNDDYGLNHGAKVLSDQLNKLKIPHQMHLREGKHEIDFALNNANHAFRALLGLQ